MSTSTKTNGNSLLKELETMYARTEHWILDYDFFEDEFKFLINLMDKHFVASMVADLEKNENVRTVVTRLLELDEVRQQIAVSNREHLAYLSRLLQNKEAFDPEECRERHTDLECEHTAFLKRYRAIKKDVFSLSTQLIELARSRRLLKS